MDFTLTSTVPVQAKPSLPSVNMKLLLVAAACLALAFGDGHDDMEHGTIVEELIKAGMRKFLPTRGRSC